jgi:hypothetical protein
MAAAASSSEARARIEGAVLLHAGFGGSEPVDGKAPASMATMEKLWGGRVPRGDGRRGRPAGQSLGRCRGAEPAGPAVREGARLRGGAGLPAAEGQGVLRGHQGKRVGRHGGVVRVRGPGPRLLPLQARLR